MYRSKFFIKDHGCFLAKNTSKNIGKNLSKDLSSKDNQKLLDDAKKCT